MPSSSAISLAARVYLYESTKSSSVRPPGNCMMGLCSFTRLKAASCVSVPSLKVRRAGLVTHTGEDFGFDLTAWQVYLVAHPELGYTHPYGSPITKKRLKPARVRSRPVKIRRARPGAICVLRSVRSANVLP